MILSLLALFTAEVMDVFTLDVVSDDFPSGHFYCGHFGIIQD